MDARTAFPGVEGAVCVITGAASGIGRSIALGFAAHGAKVVVADVDSIAGQETCMLAEGARGSAKYIECDVASEKSVKEMTRQVIGEYGCVDVLVNDAGVKTADKAITDTSLTQWETVMRVNLRGPFLCSKHCGQVMKAQRRGAIVNVGSTAGIATRWHQAPYAVSKAGLAHLTKIAALEMAEYSVRVNLVSPGATRTGMIGGTTPVESIIAGDGRWRRPGIPLGRLASPEDHVAAVLFLASNAASHITGQTIYVDGGESLL